MRHFDFFPIMGTADKGDAWQAGWLHVFRLRAPDGVWQLSKTDVRGEGHTPDEARSALFGRTEVKHEGTGRVQTLDELLVTVDPRGAVALGSIELPPASLIGWPE